MFRGIALVLKRKDGKILIIQETQKKPWKEPGDFSVPMETRNKNETLAEVIKRAINEEANGIREYTVVRKIRQKNYNILGLALVGCFLLEVTQYNNPLAGQEVKNHQWMPPEEALRLKLRPGAREMIEGFLKLSPSSSL